MPWMAWNGQQSGCTVRLDRRNNARVRAIVHCHTSLLLEAGRTIITNHKFLFYAATPATSVGVCSGLQCISIY